MNNGLIQMTLGEVMEFQRGYDLTHSQMKGGDIPVVGSSSIIGRHNVARLQKPALVIGRSGTVGRPQFFDEGIWPHNTTLFVKDYLGNDPKFCYYLLEALNLESYATSTGVPTLNRNFIHPLKVGVPSVRKQQKIAAVLSVLDGRIELNRRINAELEQIARTLYDYWFVQFDFPDANGKPYKSSNGALVYNQELKREIPEAWSAITIQSLIATSKNGDWGEGEPQGNLMKVYCIRGADINALNGQAAVLEPPVRYIRNDHTDRLLKASDLIVEISGGSPTQSTGRIAHIGEKVFGRFEAPLVCSNFCKAISLKEETHSYVVKQYWNKLYDAGIFFNFEGKTSGIKNLMFDRLIQDIYLALPNDNRLVEKYHKISSTYDEMIQNNLFQNKELTDLRDWLLPMLMNGQVSVD